MDKKGSGIFAILRKFIRHFFRSGYRNGHHVHSPYVYDLVRNVIFNKGDYKSPRVAIAYHKSLKKSAEIVEIKDFGAGSRVTESTSRTVSSIAAQSSVTIKQGTLLNRLTKWYKPEVIIEIGTGLGISSAYILDGVGDVPFYTIEGSPGKHAFAAANEHLYRPHVFDRTMLGNSSLETSNIDILRRNMAVGRHFIEGKFDDHLKDLCAKVRSRTLVFIDGDHRYEATMKFVDAFLKSAGDEEIMLVLDDIYWSDGMETSWKECVKDERVAISLDLFHLGILIKRKEIAKQHFCVKF